jgi:hypothetical protein
MYCESEPYRSSIRWWLIDICAFVHQSITRKCQKGGTALLIVIATSVSHSPKTEGSNQEGWRIMTLAFEVDPHNRSGEAYKTRPGHIYAAAGQRKYWHSVGSKFGKPHLTTTFTIGSYREGEVRVDYVHQGEMSRKFIHQETRSKSTQRDILTGFIGKYCIRKLVHIRHNILRISEHASYYWKNIFPVVRGTQRCFSRVYETMIVNSMRFSNVFQQYSNGYKRMQHWVSYLFFSNPI